MDPVTAIISGVGAAASSFFGRPKERSPRDTIRSTVKGAREMGIHPLAALGASPQYSTVSGSSAGSAAGAGLERFASALASQKSEAEIEAIKANSRAANAQAQLYEAQSRTLNQKAANAVQGGPPVPTQKGVQPVTVMGRTFTRDPKRYSSAQVAQDEFGEPGEWMVAIPSIAETVGKDTYQRAKRNMKPRKKDPNLSWWRNWYEGNY